ncbi:MAG: thiamine phosphate synthase [Acidobacteria bacterium]|nr:thiamine phosphate synthase [Acidobacteriota bacterium]
MRPLPPIYPITDAGREAPLSAQITRLGNAGFPLVQFRGKPLDPRAQMDQLRAALQSSQDNGGWPLVCVNDRADLAVLAAAEGLAPWGLHLGQGDLPHGDAARLPGLTGLRFGASTHAPEEWATLESIVDHAGVGPFRATTTKADHERPIGLDGLRSGCAELRDKGIAPIAIGGLGPEDAGACFQAGAESLAMIGAIAAAEHPAEIGWQVQRARWGARPLDPSRGILLTGSSGVGKSSLGAELARRLGLPFHDLDRRIAESEGRSIPEIFASGEAAFRALETHHLKPLLTEPCVIALGGGAWETPEIREAAQASGFKALWLAESPARCWDRVARDPNRPLAQDRAAFMARHRARLPRWAELECILPFGRSPAEVAQAMASAMSH